MSDPAVVTYGLPRVVIGAAAVTTVGVLPVFAGFSEPTLPTGALFCAGWPALGLVAAVLLDGRRGYRVGRTLAALALVPALLVLVAWVTPEPPGLWDRLAVVAYRLDVVLVLGMLAAVGWAVGLPGDRMSRRRLAWLVFWSSILASCVGVASLIAEPRTLAVVTTLGIWAYAGLVLRLVTTDELRPVDEPLADAAVVAAALLIGAAAAWTVRAGVARADVALEEPAVLFTAVVVAALAWPAALGMRRAFLARRYGTGALTHDDVVAVTADLLPQADPRELLGKAAAMVRAATGLAEVRLLLGDDPDQPSAGWLAYPLDVGQDRVGVLLIRPGDPEGPEPRQERNLRQLLPTIALMTRAVDLAVSADQARQDVSRQREQERARILGDLHDGVGPELAGMSMRVQAELRRHPTPLMESLAAGLAAARAELRRIVSGLTPSALEDTDLTAALTQLVESFDTADGQVRLEARLTVPPPPDVAVAVYRSVAEGVANALQHGRAHEVTVRVDSRREGRIHVDVHDDGIGGVIVPGVGLTSLRRRAEHLGGSLAIGPGDPTGMHLHLELPMTVTA